MAETVIESIRTCGVVGAGGAGFPTHVKLNGKADVVIINGAECEPLLRVDQQLMALYPERVLDALRLLVEQVGAERGYVSLKAHYHAAHAALSRHIGAYPNLQLHLLENFYPAGDEQVLVYETTGRIVPEGGIPLNAGVVVCNVETALNVLDAVENGRRVTDTYVTITGAVPQPKTVRIPIGVSVAEALALAGGPLPDPYVVISGGPMMGRLTAPDAPVTKTVKGLIVLPADHPLIQSIGKDVRQMLNQARTSCMNCSMCSEVCPRGMLGHRLEPHKMMRLASYGKVCDPGQSPMNAFLCCGCRLCEYACVMGLQPWNLNSQFKARMGAKGIRNELHAQPAAVHPFRAWKRFPVPRLIARLGLTEYNRDAPLSTDQPAFTRVTIPLRQHAGAAAEPVVKTGDTVERGALIGAIKEGALGANVHASIAGVVREVTPQQIVIEKQTAD